MTTLIPKYDLGLSNAVNRPINQKFQEVVSTSDFGVINDASTVNTTNFQHAIDSVVGANSAPALNMPYGYALTNTLNFNGTGTTIPTNTNANGVGYFYGQGQLESVIQATGSFSSTAYVMTANQLAGCQYSNFGVNGNSIAKYGIDFSWNFVGPALQGSVYKNIFVEGCATQAINFNNCNDAFISNITVRDVTAGNTAISAIASGGAFYMENILCMSGLFSIACQNASIVNSEFWGGVDLNLAGLNNIVWTGTHFYPNTANSNITISADSGVPGDYDAQSQEFNSCYFEACSYVVQGRFHQGARFNSCYFNAINSGFGYQVVGDSASGTLPTFIFNNCTFTNNTNVPKSVAGSYNVILNNCKILGNRLLPQTFTSQISLASGTTTNITLPSGVSLLQISHQNASSASTRTDAIYAVSSVIVSGSVDNANATSLYSHNGSVGGASFTLTQTAVTSNPVANSMQWTITNTSGSATILQASIICGFPWNL